MRQILRFAPVAVLCLALAACFASKAPLIPPGNAAFPVERLTFKGDTGDMQTLEHVGDAYRVGPPDKDGRYALLRLAPAGDDIYVAEMWAEGKQDEGGVLHALLVVDRAAGEIASYAALRPEGFEPVPGLSSCDSNACIEDLDAYVAYAKARIAAGVAPDVVYHIVAME